MATVIPTLDSRGWLEGPMEKASEIMANFIVSNKSQSNLFDISSLPWLIQQHSKDMDVLSTEVQRVLQRLFNKTFDSSTIAVEIAEPNKDLKISSMRYEMTIDATFVQDGIRYSLGKALEIVGNRVSRVIELERR